MATPTIESLVDAAVARLLELPAKDLHAVAVKKRVPFYPEDDINQPTLMKALFPDARALRKALVAGDATARRSAILLLTSADAASAWPVLAPFLAKKAPTKTKGFDVLVEMVPYLVGTIPNIPEDELLPLFVNPKVDPNALVAGVLYHRKKPEERLAVLGRALSAKRNPGTEYLAGELAAELSRRTRDPLAEVLRAASHASWKAWTNEVLGAMGEATSLRKDAKARSIEAPRKVVTAAVTLGPEHWSAIEPQFFSKKALRTKAGREEAATILHTITTIIRDGGAKAWKKQLSFVALVDSLANAEGETLGRTADDLNRVLRGKKPRS
jgi:hypothetical protein